MGGLRRPHMSNRGRPAQPDINTADQSGLRVTGMTKQTCRSTSQPPVMRALTTGVCPLLAATAQAVDPAVVMASTSALAASSRLSHAQRWR